MRVERPPCMPASLALTSSSYRSSKSLKRKYCTSWRPSEAKPWMAKGSPIPSMAPHNTTRLHRGDHMFLAARDVSMFEEGLIDEGGSALALALLEHRDPIWPVQLHLIVPFLIVLGLAHGLRALELVEGDAFLVEIKRRLEAPDLLRVVTRELAIDLVDHLHHVD